MKIVIRHEPAGSQGNEDSQTCVWTIGDDGETQATEYLKEGEQVDLDVNLQEAVQSVEVGTVGPIATPDDGGEASTA